MTKKVVIVGAGMSGLSAAHYLAKFTNHEIHIYEQSDRIGGLVASDRTDLGMPTQHSPRIILPGYDLLTGIMEDIDVDTNLVEADSIIIRDSKVETVSHIPKTNMSEFIYLSYTLLDGLLSCNQRAKLLDRLYIHDIIKSEKGKRWIGLLSHVAGESPEIMPIYKLLRFLEVDIKSLLNENKKVGAKHTNTSNQSYALNGPYSERFLGEWYEYLTNEGVTFHFETKVHKINEQKQLVVQKAFSKPANVDVDIIVLALDLHSLNSVLKHSNMDTYYGLEDRTFSEQLGLQLGFANKVRLPHKKPCFLALDTAWQLVIEPQELNYEDVMLGQSIRSLWSINIPDINLEYMGKAVKDCSDQEIIDRVMLQITEALHVKPDLVHSSINDPIKPYAWNAANTLHMRPKMVVAEDVYLASALVDNDYYFTYKEGACEAALNVVEAIVSNTLIKRNRRVSLLSPVHKVDQVLFQLQLPSFVNSIMIFVLFYMVSKIITRIKT